MSEDKYTSEFKARVALDAVSQSRSVIAEIAEKYDVSEEEVIAWTNKLQHDAAHVFSGFDSSGAEAHEQDEDVEDVSLETEDESFATAVNYGAMSDDMNYSKLIFWSTLGTAMVVIFVVGLVYFAQYSLFESQQQASFGSDYSQIRQLDEAQEQELNSFGVVDAENGIYRIPIDSAISRLAVD